MVTEQEIAPGVYSYGAKCPEPLSALQAGKNRAALPEISDEEVPPMPECKPAKAAEPEEAADAAPVPYLKACRAHFELDILPMAEDHIGPGGRFFLPPTLIEHYAKVLDIAEGREEKMTRMVEVLARYAAKIRRLQETIARIKAKEKELFELLIATEVVRVASYSAGGDGQGPPAIRNAR